MMGFTLMAPFYVYLVVLSTVGVLGNRDKVLLAAAKFGSLMRARRPLVPSSLSLAFIFVVCFIFWFCMTKNRGWDVEER